MKNLILMVCSLFFLNCHSQQTDNVKKESVAGFKKALEKEIQLVDVRTPSEFSEGYISYAENINVMASDFEQKIQKLDKEKPVYIYCRSGQRSNKAAQKMKELGFEEIYDLEGGILAWEKSGENLSK